MRLQCSPRQVDGHLGENCGLLGSSERVELCNVQSLFGSAAVEWPRRTVEESLDDVVLYADVGPTGNSMLGVVRASTGSNVDAPNASGMCFAFSWTLAASAAFGILLGQVRLVLSIDVRC